MRLHKKWQWLKLRHRTTNARRENQQVSQTHGDYGKPWIIESPVMAMMLLFSWILRDQWLWSPTRRRKNLLFQWEEKVENAKQLCHLTRSFTWWIKRGRKPISISHSCLIGKTWLGSLPTWMDLVGSLVLFYIPILSFLNSYGLFYLLIIKQFCLG